ncbi:uncharacterized protein LOC114286284 [Camellia sinensis]|uniref:uncharacterized protein LOC114286284 n=1 Tax=Camellia sinensis TaxID=4442 RepID=UPI001035CF69|nr:uncharacterized protein LOC114286284 [Camellia sinensis]
MSEGCTSAPIFLLCKYNGCTFAIKIDQNVTYDQLVEKLCLKWDNLQSDNIFLSYSLPGHPNCTLDNNEALDLLFALVVHFDSKCIDVVVRVQDSTIDYGYLNKRLDYGERESMLDLEACDIALSHDSSKSVNLSNRASKSSKRNSRLEVEEEVNMLSSFCRHKEKVLLSAGWANDKVRVTAQCLFRETKGCMWNVHGKVENANGFFYIRKLNNVHTCGAEVRTMNHSRMSSDLVADLIVEGVRDNPLTRPVHVVQDFKLGYGLRLRWYVDVAKSCNPGSYIEFECDDDTKQFKRLFERFRGNLLAATGKDGNQDRNLGLVEVLPKVFPMAFHAYCLYHLKMNLRHHLRGMFHGLKEKLITLFGKCAYAPTEETFHQCLVELKTEDCNVDGDSEVVLPPLSKKQPGRPNKKRIHSNGEKVRQITCSRCGNVGNHNKKLCKEAL